MVSVLGMGERRFVSRMAGFKGIASKAYVKLMVLYATTGMNIGTVDNRFGETFVVQGTIVLILTVARALFRLGFFVVLILVTLSYDGCCT